MDSSYDKIITVEYLDIEICKLKRRLPIVAIGPKIKIPSVSLLGDVELVGSAAEELAQRSIGKGIEVLIGPETKVVPLLQEMSKIMELPRYVVCRKGIQPYMVSPVVVAPPEFRNNRVKSMAIDGIDADYLRGKKVMVVDDVVFTGGSFWVIRELIDKVGASYCGMVSVFKQGDKFKEPFNYLFELPIFEN